MIPILLRLSGFLSYQETAELDFSSFDLACISGANGAGKSSLLDAITWALFGLARRKDDTLINSHAASAEVAFEFMYENNRYRVQRGKAREKSVVLEFYVQNAQGGWSTLSERTVRDTEAKIQQTLRLDYETFTNASFFLQGKADQFAQQRPGDRKRILSTILGLELWESYREGAANRRKTCEIDLAALDSRLAEIDAELGQEDERRARLKQMEASLGQMEALRRAKEGSLEGLHRLESSLKEQGRMVEVLQRQAQAARQRLAQRQAQWQARQEERLATLDQLAAESEVQAAYERWQADRLELGHYEELASSFRQYDGQRAAPLMAIAAERAGLEQQQTHLRQQQRQAEEMQHKAAQIEAELSQARVEESQVKEAYVNWQAARKQLGSLEKLAGSYRQLDARRHAPLVAIERARSGLEQERTGLLEAQRQAQELDRQRFSFGQTYGEALRAIGELRERLEKRPALEARQKDLQETRAQTRAENERLKLEMNVLKERVDRLEEASGADCPLCGQPLNDSERQALIDALNGQGKEMGERYRAHLEELKGFEQAVKLLEVELVGLRSLEQNELQAQTRRAAGLEERLKQIESGLETWSTGGALRLSELERILAAEEFAPEARRELAELQERMQALNYDPAAHQALLEAEQAGRASEERLQVLSRQIATLEEQLKQAGAILAAWQDGHAARLVQIEATLEAEAFAAAARAELEQVDELLRSLGYDPAVHDALRRAELDGRQTEARLRQLESVRASLAASERELLALEAQCQADESEAAAQEETFRQAEVKFAADSASLPDVEQVEQEVFDLKEQEGKLKMQVGGARQQVEVLKSLKSRRKDFLQRRAELTVQIGRYKQLEKAFGKDGVPALLIEQALPELELQANEVLDRLSGGEMSVRFATQKDYRDRSRDDKKETLDILISDSAGTREYELFSGGEAFRVNFAIRLALSRLLAQRAGARLQTLVIDEGFGSQDTEGRQRLIEAINLVKPDFAKVLVITHMEELKDAFPARIEVEKTPKGSRLQVL